jgi:hypothetical protein
MIKRIRLAARRPGVSAAGFPSVWARAAEIGAAAGDGVGPVRTAIDVTLPDIEGTPRYDGVGLEWFTDDDHLGRYEAWLAGTAGASATRMLAAAIDLDRSPLLVAAEHVIRGADWLAGREGDRTVILKHLAVARRAAGLSADAFAERWRAHAGTAGGRPIPDAARGRAYVQNHPCPPGAWPWDAITEVYVDGPDGLRARVDWLRANVDDAVVADLVGERWFLAVEETLVDPADSGR